MRIVDLGDVQINWREDGDPSGAPVVFANSLGTDLRLWDKVIPLLPQGLRLIRYDKRGHGLSSCPNALYSMEELSSDAERFLDKISVQNCVFVGLSIGGMIGQALAAQRPDLVHALVLSNTAAKIGDSMMWQSRIEQARENGIEALANSILERWFSVSFRKTDELAAWRNMLTRTPLEGYVGCCNAIAETDMRVQTAKLILPALGIAGSEDGATPPSLLKETMGLILGANFKIIKDAGHLPCVEKPKQYAEIITAFLREVGHV